MILFLIIVAVAAVALLESRMALGNLESVQADHRPDEKLVDPDETFHLELSAKNTSRKPILFLKLEEQLPQYIQPAPDRHIRKSMDGGHTAAFTTWLRSHQTVTFRIHVSIGQRGLYPLRPLKVSAGDFLGLKEEVQRLERFRAVIVAPREAPPTQVSEVLGGFLGDVSVRRFIHEDPVLTMGFREYTGREPMKAISWTQSARGRGLMVKKYDYTSERSVSVLLNVDSSVTERDMRLEQCFSLTRTVCRILEAQGISYNFTTNADLAGATADGLGDGFGTQHFAAVLECLGRATYLTRYDREKLLEKSLESDDSAGRILITPGDDFTDSSALQRMQTLSTVLVLRAEEAMT